MPEKQGVHIALVDLAREIRNGEERAFEKLYFEFYYPLCRFAFRMLRSGDLARDAVQEVFCRVWNERETLDLKYSVKAYLYRSVRNQAINMIKHQELQVRLFEELKKPEHQPDNTDRFDLVNNRNALAGIATNDIIRKIWLLLEDLPEQQKMVFELHRKHGLTYQEIGEVLNITRKTVENHMGKALKYLREQLDINQYQD